jgi:hypothetical protein
MSHSPRQRQVYESNVLIIGDKEIYVVEKIII